MNINFNAFVRVLGLSMFLMSGAMLIPLIAAFYYNETGCIKAFLSVMAICITLGTFTKFFVKSSKKNLTMRDSFLIVPIFWIIASIISSAPFIIEGCIKNPIFAFFEMTSGLTTTGSSVLADVEALPKSMLYWRSFTHWLGGMGILIFMLALLPSIGITGNALAAAEAPGPTMDKLTPKISDTARNLYRMYTIFTIVMIVILMLCGMTFFDASAHAFGSIGTGGFGLYNNSISHYQSPLIEWIIAGFMVFSGINFNLYFYALTKKNGYKILFKDEEFKFYIILIALATFAITVNLFKSGLNDIFAALRTSFFQVASIITTTGYATQDFNLWPTFSKMILIILMIIGGCSSSTSGGIKVVRILTMLKLIKRGIQVQLHPNAIISIKMNEKKLSIDSINLIMSMIFLHIAIVSMSTLIVSLNGYDIITSFTACLACIGNIGPGFNLVGPCATFNIFSEPVLFLLSMLMIAGRLELYTFIMIFVPHFWKQDI
ncbi:MAG: TrkH family potassium uptake protein [Eubacteriales bacterium]